MPHNQSVEISCSLYCSRNRMKTEMPWCKSWGCIHVSMQIWNLSQILNLNPKPFCNSFFAFAWRIFAWLNVFVNLTCTLTYMSTCMCACHVWAHACVHVRKSMHIPVLTACAHAISYVCVYWQNSTHTYLHILNRYPVLYACIPLRRMNIIQNIHKPYNKKDIPIWTETQKSIIITSAYTCTGVARICT